MINNLKYIKNILKVLIWPVVFMIGQFFIQYIFVAYFNSKEKGNMTNNEFLEYIKTLSYQNKLNNYINSNTLLIMFIMLIIFIPIFYSVLKKYKTNNKFKLKSVIEPLLFGITISIIYNISLFNINNIFNFTNRFEPSNLNIIVNIICSGICGPLLEEILFRGIVYNELKKFNRPMTSIILTSLIFAVFHTDLINSIYAFGVSFILIYLYEKYKNLKAPIIMHMSLNITIILLINLITKNFIIFNLYLLILNLIILVILRIKIKYCE